MTCIYRSRHTMMTTYFTQIKTMILCVDKKYFPCVCYFQTNAFPSDVGIFFSGTCFSFMDCRQSILRSMLLWPRVMSVEGDKSLLYRQGAVNTVYPMEYAQCFVILCSFVAVFAVSCKSVCSTNPYSSSLFHWELGQSYACVSVSGLRLNTEWHGHTWSISIRKKKWSVNSV